ncbi:hypothetical protein KTN05_10405 [Paracoccus sp. Z118]|uniref:hypothetical protein n=1 Tax=Paracoccus sp. Z118 TaxID=2851017 RepID=UPI001C2CA9AC|nr:hypothetical protein [Paracoccus sp. Z118]MBV0892264.1 hypothetical protein [Paracoccus sp. Z118]
METNVCKRNCWIAGGVLGLLIVIFGGPGFGFVAALFLGILAGGILGGMLQWLACDGAGGRAHGQVADGPEQREVNINRHDDPEAHEVVLMGSGAGRFGSVVPVGELAAPSGIVAGAKTTMSEGAVPAATGQGQAPTFGQSYSPAASAGQAAPEPLAGDSPVEDTRAVLHDPSQSEHHDMPGEAVPVAEPGGAQDERPPREDVAEAGKSKPRSSHKRGGKVRVVEPGPGQGNEG